MTRDITKLTNEEIEKLDIFEVFNILGELSSRPIPDIEDNAGKAIAEAIFQKSLLYLLEKRFQRILEDILFTETDTVYYILRNFGIEGSIFFNGNKVFISDSNINKFFQNYEKITKLLNIYNYQISFYSNYLYSKEILLPLDFYKEYRIFEKYVPNTEIKDKIIMEKVIVYFLLKKITNSNDIFISLDENRVFLKAYGIYKYKTKSLKEVAELFEYIIITPDVIITKNDIIPNWTEYAKYLKIKC